MANKWYFKRDSKTHGPYSAGELRGLAATGQLRPRDSVWKEGMENQVLAAKVKDLFTASQLHPTPPTADATPRPSPRAPAAAPAGAPEEIPDDIDLAPLAADDLPSAETDAPKAEAARQAEAGPKLSEEAPAKTKAERPPPSPHVNKRRVLAVKGGTMMGQDGATVRFRKKCQKCGHDDTSVTTMPIPPGFVRLSFFCYKCKKNNMIEVQGVNC